MQTVAIQQQRPKEYMQAMEELKNSFVTSIEIVNKLNVLGHKYGLSPQEIRRDIETALDGVIKPRQLRSLLPLELKNVNKSRHVAAIAAAKSFQFTGHIVKYTRGRHCIILSEKMNISRYLDKSLKITLEEQ